VVQVYPGVASCNAKSAISVLDGKMMTCFGGGILTDCDSDAT
jgi:hypothetical protein